MERRLSAILAADVVGYSRLMGIDEAGTLSALKAHRQDLLDGRIASHQGRIVKVTGDGLLVEFPSVVNALACAAEIQRRMRERNADVPEARRIEFRIGINLGDIIFEDDDIFGDGVNVAARVESMAKPGGVAISGTVRDHVGDKVDVTFEDTGEHLLKNIDRPVRIFNVGLFVDAARTHRSTATEPPAKEKPSIVVLPFNNMSGDPEQEYFADGITEDLITDLSKVSGLAVIARNSVFMYKGKPADVQEVSRRFNATTVLEGSVRKAGQRVRITAQLINGKDGTHLWADRYDRDLTDIFAIQDEITRTIVEQLKVRLLPEEKKAIATASTTNVEAYAYYLRGRQFLHLSTKSHLLLARSMFSKAVELDPLYARAYAGIADCDSVLNAWHRVEISPDSILAIVDKALEIDPDLAEAHAARGVALNIGGRYAEAARAFERSIELEPNGYEAHYAYARFWVAEGNFERAATYYKRALDIRPDDYRSPVHLKKVLNALGRKEEALSYARLGLKRAEEALLLQPESSDPAQMGACALAALGDRGRALEWVARAQSIDPEDNNARWNAACTFAILGEFDRAIGLLEIWLQLAGNDDKRWFRNDPDFDELRKYQGYGRIAGLVA